MGLLLESTLLTSRGLRSFSHPSILHSVALHPSTVPWPLPINMADHKDLEMVSIGDVKEDSMENQTERKSGSRVENKAVLEVSNHGSRVRQNKV